MQHINRVYAWCLVSCVSLCVCLCVYQGRGCRPPYGVRFHCEQWTVNHGSAQRGTLHHFQHSAGATWSAGAGRPADQEVSLPHNHLLLRKSAGIISEISFLSLRLEYAHYNMTQTINHFSPPANLLLMWYQGSWVLAWQGGEQWSRRFSSRYQLLVSSKVWKRRANSWTFGCVFWRVRRIPDLQITSGPISPEWRSFS